MKRTWIFRAPSPLVILLAGFTLGAPIRADDPANYLFAASQTSSEITIIDSSIDQVIGQITLPDRPGDMVALGRGRSLAVADRKANLVRLIDVAGQHVERVMGVPVVPDVLRSDSKGSTLAVLDRNTGKVALGPTGGTFRTVPNISDVAYMVFDSKGRLLVANRTGAAIVDSTGQQVAELAADRANGPVMDVAADPGGEYAFVEQPLRGVVSVFDMRNATRTAMLNLPAPLGRIVPSQDSQFVLVPAGEKSISVISMWNLSEKARFDTGVEPDSIGLAFFQSVVIIIGQSAQRMMLYDLWGKTHVGDIRLPGRPGLGAITSDGSRFYVPLPETGQIASINLVTRRIDHLIDNVGIGVSTVVPGLGNSYCH